MKFIHTADLHLDSPFEGLKNIPNTFFKQLYTASMTAFTEIVDEAIKQTVDFVLIAGDVYDNPHPGVAAQLFLQKEFTKLQEAGVPVYICLGNHDYLNLDEGTFVYPDNVYVFPNQVTTKSFFVESQSVSITSFSYGRQWVKNQTESFPHKDFEKWHIGMIHGECSNEYEKVRYAPFSISELKSKNYDYWALGHIHKREVLSKEPPIIYPGNIQGKNIKESGVKGYYLVEEKEGKLTPHFCPVNTIQWSEIHLKITKEDTFTTLQNKVVAELMAVEEQKTFARALIIRVVLKVSFTIEAGLKERIINGMFLQQLQNGFQSNKNLFLYEIILKNLKVQQNNIWDMETEKRADSLVFQANNLYQLADNLVQYQFIEKHFLQSATIENIKNKSKAYLETEMDGD
ncbi:metallophosphoesterase family protein [Liquorilactobacillus capillatus]|uniref:Metallophosphoesterase n=1 Tax=Liquorilactobacillus capillatus DSM 19910 TaxID=1423731 RepID=A0A0R1MFT0_9LACO|nr:DNA repair exonuclease [Liquorilactobacillus capillatus]KRL03179.1 metallophosphoesterase [Liquorilactobacillus capillatus DSM 19910]